MISSIPKEQSSPLDGIEILRQCGKLEEKLKIPILSEKVNSPK